jgi:hypothetical protein
MSSVQSVAPVPISYPAIPPVQSSAVSVLTSALPPDTVTIGSSGIASTQAYQQTAIQLAQETPQQIAQLAADGNSEAKQILAREAASRKLLDRVDVTA